MSNKERVSDIMPRFFTTVKLSYATRTISYFGFCPPFKT